jgi:signal transduction histidine kinase
VERVSQQTFSTYEKIKDDIFQLSQNPLVQLSFLQFSYGQRMETVQNKLGQHRANYGYDSIALYTFNGQIIVKSFLSKPYENLSRKIFEKVFEDDYVILEKFDLNKIIFLKRVFDYEDETNPVGILAIEVNLSKFISFVKEINIGEGVVKTVKTSEGKVIFKSEGNVFSNSYKVFVSKVPILNWSIVLSVPDNILLKDIIELKNKSIAFSILVAIFAFISAMIFIDKLMSPLRRIIEGIKQFASGKLEYRINMKTGKELKLLSDAFDNMAENLQKRQNEMVQTNKLASLGLLAAGIAHEIKNPLAGIKTSIQVQLMKTDDKVIRELSSGILEEVDRLNKIITDLLNFSKPSPSNRIKCGLLKTVNHCLNLIKKDLNDKNITLVNKTEEFEIIADESQLRQILLNLLLNAINAVNKDTGVITLNSGINDEGKVYLSIQDNGKGIPENKINQIFDPFFSLSQEGIGLGLSVVFSLLKQNKIEHVVESKENIGTKFTLIFSEE